MSSDVWLSCHSPKSKIPNFILLSLSLAPAGRWGALGGRAATGSPRRARESRWARFFSLQRCRYRRWPPPRLRAEQVDHLSVLFVHELGLDCKVCALFGDTRR